MIENGFNAAAITEALDPEKDFGEEDTFFHLIWFLCICLYVYVTIHFSELFKCLFFLLQNLSQTFKIRLQIGSKNARK